VDNPRDEIQKALSRRELLARIGAGCAGLLAAGTLSGLGGCSRESDPVIAGGQLLTEQQMHLLRAMVDVIIPATATPGAAAADVHGFIDDQLAHCRSPEEGAQFVRDLDEAGASIRQEWSSLYWELSPQVRIDVMAALSTGESPFPESSVEFFHKLRDLTVLGYYLSEIGATRELVYLPVPGGYDGDFKVADNNGKVFAPHRF
jgi:hypothetical protein